MCDEVNGNLLPPSLRAYPLVSFRSGGAAMAMDSTAEPPVCRSPLRKSVLCHVPPRASHRHPAVPQFCQTAHRFTRRDDLTFPRGVPSFSFFLLPLTSYNALCYCAVRYICTVPPRGCICIKKFLCGTLIAPSLLCAVPPALALLRSGAIRGYGAIPIPYRQYVCVCGSVCVCVCVCVDGGNVPCLPKLV